jgi:hypothetical protein
MLREKLVSNLARRHETLPLAEPSMVRRHAILTPARGSSENLGFTASGLEQATDERR